jgi:hypothetical protein
MSKYGVTLPISGTIYVEVEASGKEDAIQKALQAPLDINDDSVTWEATDVIVRGNVFLGMQNQASVKEIDE